ncbi:MAG: hypothetical protein QF570_12445 [Myxococcota bacterium]|nr:hypothetical protein [Myxococcota bacterium]
MVATINNVANAIFDLLMAPLGHEWVAIDMLVWPCVMGVVALQVYKMVSNQAAIISVKRQISMHLLEIRLFRDDIMQVFKSLVQIVVKNFLYIAHNLTPMVVMLVPMVMVMVQMVSHYGYEPSKVGAVELLHVKLDSSAGVSTKDVSLSLPEGVSLDAPVVRTASGDVFWRLRAEQAGDHTLALKLGGRELVKQWAVGGDVRRVPVKRLRSWEALLYPGEAALPSDGPVVSIELASDVRALDYFPDGEGGILLWAMALSIVAGIALKDVFGVTF